MLRKFLLFVPLPLLLAVLACNSSTTVRVPSPGEVILETTGTTQSARGNVSLVDANGNPVAVPASGCAVFIGTSTLGAGTTRLGLFHLLGLPRAVLGMWAGALGYLPFIAQLPLDANRSLAPGTCRLQPDPNPNDNPRFLDQPREPIINVGIDGIPRLTGYLPNDNSVLKVFMSPGSEPGTLDGAAGVALDTQFGAAGQDRFFQTTLPQTFSTGALYACLFSPTGFELLAMNTCDLTITATVTGATGDISGNVAMPVGSVGVGKPEVIAWEEGNFDNNIGFDDQDDWDTLTATGSFAGKLPNPPAAGAKINVLVRWKDGLGDWHSCTKQF